MSLLDFTGPVLTLLFLCGGDPAGPDTVKVTVVAILATDRKAEVHPKLECIAREVQKKEPQLKGFRMGKTHCESVQVGKKRSFELVEKQEIWVVVRHGVDKAERVGLTVKPPLVGEVAYTTTCGKFFPIVTRYTTKKDNERLIIAIMVRPCRGKAEGDNKAKKP